MKQEGGDEAGPAVRDQDLSALVCHAGKLSFCPVNVKHQ